MSVLNSPAYDLCPSPASFTTQSDLYSHFLVTLGLILPELLPDLLSDIVSLSIGQSLRQLQQLTVRSERRLSELVGRH